MRYFLFGAILTTLSVAGCGSSGPIGKACSKSDRSAATPALCSCVQGVANQSLTRSEQRRAVRFFKDPQRAQDTRQSDRPSDERFWRRYKAFGQRAERLCHA